MLLEEKKETVVTKTYTLTLTEDEASILYSIMRACAASDKDTNEFTYNLYCKLSASPVPNLYESRVVDRYLHTHKKGYVWG
jgi:hypothetical protein